MLRHKISIKEMCVTEESAQERWRRLYDAAGVRSGEFATMSGIPLAPVYGTDDAEYPGVYPYTRGVHASMYRTKLWTMRMFAGFGTATDTNERFREIIRSGGTGLSTAFDMPTLLGLDSDDPMAIGEVGRCGVAIDTLADVRDLFSGIDLANITTSMTINSPRPSCSRCSSPRPKSRASIVPFSAARCKTTS
jgi:methylmalonyl-CoA mutase N-terminal domain/subunit